MERMTDRQARLIDIAGVTDVGLKRRHNEDSYLAAPDLGLVVVADGMGGHDKGEVASRLAVDAMSSHMLLRCGDIDAHSRDGLRRQLDLLRDAVAAANRRVFEENAAQGYPEGAGMGTTIVGFYLLHPADHVGVFHVGDSRLYRFRDDSLDQLTRDHTLYQDWLDNGQVGSAPRRNIILRALGPWPQVDAEVSLHRVLSGDILLACSDGLTGLVAPATIAEVLRDTMASGGSLAEAGDQLVELAKLGGGDDNITVVLARCR
jgi:protein phosphatase